MTIFDVIRYPISIPPTEEELEALPRELFNKWTLKVNFSTGADPYSVVRWYEFQLRYNEEEDECRHDIELLRKMLGELQ